MLCIHPHRRAWAASRRSAVQGACSAHARSRRALAAWNAINVI
jgi:hypothetical protein